MRVTFARSSGARQAPESLAVPTYVARPIFPDLDDVRKTLDGIWERGILTNSGPLHQALEVQLAERLAVDHLCLAGSGTTALLLAMRALDLTGEVITTPFTFPATTHVLLWLGLTPVFVDIDPRTMTISPEAIELAITPRTSAILGVHVYGIPCDVAAIAAIAKTHGLRVVYDAAHAFGTRIGETSVLDYGDASALSFHATKLFHTGEGGAVVAPDAACDRKLKLLRNFGIASEVDVPLAGINGKLSELQAALGLHVLPLVDEEMTRRREIAAIYRERLGRLPGMQTVSVPEGISDSLQYFVVRISDRGARDALYERLKSFNVFARRYFYPLCSTFPSYRELPSSRADRLPVAHAVANEVLCLPFFGALGPEGTEQICDIIDYLSP